MKTATAMKWPSSFFGRAFCDCCTLLGKPGTYRTKCAAPPRTAMIASPTISSIRVNPVCLADFMVSIACFFINVSFLFSRSDIRLQSGRRKSVKNFARNEKKFFLTSLLIAGSFCRCQRVTFVLQRVFPESSIKASVGTPPTVFNSILPTTRFF